MFFAIDRDQSTHPDAAQRDRPVRWLWRTFFTRRYSKRLEQLNQDIKELVWLRAHDPECALGDFPIEFGEPFFNENPFNVRNVDTKTFILMLASAGPLDFVGGGRVELGAVLRGWNKKEFHHLYPRAYLGGLGVPEGRVNALANFCILPRASNNQIGDRRPGEYRRLMPADPARAGEILRSALCSPSLFGNDFEQFRKDRVTLLMQHARRLTGV